MTHTRLIAGLLLLLAIGGCGGPSYKASPATPISAGPNDGSSQHVAPMLGESGQYSVLADPYTDLDRQRAVFDADFVELGIIAIQLKVRNTSGDSKQVRGEDMTLTLPGGHRLTPINAHSAASLVEEKTGINIPGGMASELVFELLGPPLTTCPPTCILRSQKFDRLRAQASREKRVADYRDKEFRDALLVPGASTSGFVFFRPPPGTPAFDEADLSIQFLPATGAAGATISQSVAGLRYAGSDPDPVAAYVPRSRRGSRPCDSGGNPSQRWIGIWEAKAGDAVITVNISDHAVSGRIVTIDGNYRLNGTVNANGEIEADIGPSVTENGATLRGRFPLLVTTVDATGAEQYRSLANLAFHLCS